MIMKVKKIKLGKERIKIETRDLEEVKRGFLGCYKCRK